MSIGMKELIEKGYTSGVTEWLREVVRELDGRV